MPLLRIDSTDGSPANDYRIRDGLVEFRVLDPTGRPYASRLSIWRKLNDNEIELHHALGTVVSEWLRLRMGSVPVHLDKAA